MEKFTVLKAKAVSIPVRDIDTDMIIPAQFLTSTSREGYGQNLFRRLREQDPNFPTNRPESKGAQILVAGANFGCGSSREHAVWALLGSGFRAVISSSFADIFTSNSGKNGLLLVTLPEPVTQNLCAQASSGELHLEVDLSSQTVTHPDGTKWPFPYDPFRKHCLLTGQDDLDYLLAEKEEIAAYRAQRDGYRFYKTTEANR